MTIISPDQSEHQTWCNPEGNVQYQLGDHSVEQINYPGCIVSPGLALDVDGQPHLVWYKEEKRDTNGIERTDNLLVESIRTEDGWSEPAIVTTTDGPVTLSLSSAEGGNLHLIWVDMDENFYTSIQEVYECNEAELSDLERAGYDLVVKGGFRPADSTIPWCCNRFDRFYIRQIPILIIAIYRSLIMVCG